MDTLNSQQQADNDALATAVGVAAQELGLDGVDVDVEGDIETEVVDPDFSAHELLHHKDEDEEVDVTGLNLPGDDDMDDDLGLNLDDLDDNQDRVMFSRPPSIRKACDLCHAAKQKCSGDRPTCTRCATGGWQCNYAPRQRRRTVPKAERTAAARAQDAQNATSNNQNQSQSQASQSPRASTVPRDVAPPAKKRKIDTRNSLGFESAIDLKAAMAALDMGYAEDDGEEMMSMTDEQMIEAIAIDGYLSDLPLQTFVNNLPYTNPQGGDGTNFNSDEMNADNFHAADIDQHTTSALRDAIFSLNESTRTATGENGDEAQAHTEEVDPHIALLDLSHAETANGHTEDHDLLDLNLGCNHPAQVPHILALLLQHSLEPKAGFSTPLTLSVFAPLARSLRLFQLLTDCPTCSTSPQQTLPQLALLSRTTTILTFAFPPIHSSALGGSAQITIHGARLAGTGISEAIEQHIVGVVWDSWRASVREIFALLDRKAQDIIQQSSAGEGLPVTSAETQRAGLFFQAMGRLVTAMDEVEGS